MTAERNLYRSWFRQKTVWWFLLVLLFGYLITLILEMDAYVADVPYAIERYEVHIKQGTIRVDETGVYDYLMNGFRYLGISYSAFCMLFLGILSVHKESFSENWYMTLRRIPNYRGKYMCVKLGTVLFPGIMYLGYQILYWLLRWGEYERRVPEEFRSHNRIEFFGLAPFRPMNFVELCLYIVLYAVLVLLLSFTLRNVKKDVIGFMGAVLGLAITFLLFFKVIYMPHTIVCFFVLGMLIAGSVAFLMRHVYRKL